MWILNASSNSIEGIAQFCIHVQLFDYAFYQFAFNYVHRYMYLVLQGRQLLLTNQKAPQHQLSAQIFVDLYLFSFFRMAVDLYFNETKCIVILEHMHNRLLGKNHGFRCNSRYLTVFLGPVSPLRLQCSLMVLLNINCISADTAIT